MVKLLTLEQINTVAILFIVTALILIIKSIIALYDNRKRK
jgi:hypothetical protein